MAQPTRQPSRAAGKKLPIRLLILWLVITLAAMLFIVFRRGQMNYANRADYILQRLDDYPRLQEHYLRETEELQTLWDDANLMSRAQQAAFFFRHDEKHPEEEEKLRYIADITWSSEARILSGDQKDAFREESREKGLNAAFAPLEDGRILALSFPADDISLYLQNKEYSNLLVRLEAGLPGYAAILRDGNLSIYPEDDQSEAIKALIAGMIASGQPDYAAMKQQADQAKEKRFVQSFRSAAIGPFPAGTFVLHCAAYAESDDLVISIEKMDDMLRLGQKRTWSLCILTAAVFLFLGLTLWRTRLYSRSHPSPKGLRIARRNCSILLITACLVLVLCVVVIQMLSGVNLSAESAAASVSFLQKKLEQESYMNRIITSAFDLSNMQHVQTCARFLSDNPQAIGMDTLRELDTAMGGIALRVISRDGQVLASDEMFQPNAELDALQDRESHVYRAALTDGKGTAGFVDLYANPERLNFLLQETRLKDTLEDLHMLDTMHVVAVDKADKNIIAASSRPAWVNDTLEEHGISPSVMYDGYEGLMRLDGEQTYACVFSWDNYIIAVASEGPSAIVFLKGIAVLLGGILLLVLLLHEILIREIYTLQERDESAESAPEGDRYPSVRFFMRGFMLALFCLSFALLLITNGNPTGLTYNMVRGVWVRGVNVVTVTTCIMAISAVVSLYILLEYILNRISRRLSPKGRTMCQMIRSGSHYIGTIFIILYTLSILGVDTGTLLGGVGVTALIFTLGANSLLADVVAGIFILFEGDITVGDIVTIDGFRGYVTDISIRTTKLTDNASRDIKIINNSLVRNVINQSRKESCVLIDIPVSHDFGLVRAEQVLRERLAELPSRYPEIIGQPEYLGVIALPEQNAISQRIAGCKVRVRFRCLEKNRTRLSYLLHREMVQVTHILLNDESEAGLAGCQIVSDTPSPDRAP